jgi:RNA polymerase sigma factor (TIGR02999 family)
MMLRGLGLCPFANMSDVTRILEAIEGGDARAAGELLPAVYEELRRLAARRLAQERPGQTLQPTALVHEAYLRLVGSGDRNPAGWQGRAHFFAAAAEAMRRILIDNARRKAAERHGGERKRVELSDVIDDHRVPEPLSDDVLALDKALGKLAAEDPAKADLVKLRYFAGLTLEQAANTLGLSRATAARYWAYARAWLHQEITRGEAPSA